MKVEYCSNCGVKLEENANFCQKCGTKFATVAEKKLNSKEKDIIKTINHNIAMENNQETIVRRSYIVIAIFALLTILPFMEWSPIAGFWALSLISLFLFITSLVVMLMFRGRAEKMQTLISGENLLAEWTLTREQKENYVNYFYEQEKSNGVAVLLSIAFVSVIVFGLFILFIDEGKLAMLGVWAGLMIFLSFFAFGMPLYYRNSNAKGDGRVLIGAKYAYINGYFHNWDFILSGLSRIKIIKEPFYGINLVYYYTDRTLKHSEEIFIPANEDIDLKTLVEQMQKLNPKRRKRKSTKKQSS